MCVVGGGGGGGGREGEAKFCFLHRLGPSI